jgi:hypothetical protein
MRHTVAGRLVGEERVQAHRVALFHPQDHRSLETSDVASSSTGAVALADQGLGQAVLMRLRCARVSAPRSSFYGFRVPPEVIMAAVRWYLRYGCPTYRDVEELLAERGIDVDHVTVYRWVQRFTPLLIDAARPCRHVPGDRWFVDET